MTDTGRIVAVTGASSVIGLAADILYDQIQGIEKIHNAVPPLFSLGSSPEISMEKV